MGRGILRRPHALRGHYWVHCVPVLLGTWKRPDHNRGRTTFTKAFPILESTSAINGSIVPTPGDTRECSIRRKWCSRRKPVPELFSFFLLLWQAVEAHMVERHRGSHIFLTIGSQMAVKMPAVTPAGRPLLQARFPVFISVNGWVGLMAIVRPEGLRFFL
jgi:hypothetical protein